MASRTLAIIFLFVGVASAARPQHAAVVEEESIEMAAHGSGMMGHRSKHYVGTHASASAAAGQQGQAAGAAQSFDFSAFDENKDGILSREEFIKAQQAQAKLLGKSIPVVDTKAAKVTETDANDKQAAGDKAVKAHVHRRKNDDDDWDDLD